MLHEGEKMRLVCTVDIWVTNENLETQVGEGIWKNMLSLNFVQVEVPGYTDYLKIKGHFKKRNFLVLALIPSRMIPIPSRNLILLVLSSKYIQNMTTSHHLYCSARYKPPSICYLDICSGPPNWPPCSVLVLFTLLSTRRSYQVTPLLQWLPIFLKVQAQSFQ